MSLWRNPEFRRHVWLDLTLQRLIGAPLILGLVFLTVSLTEAWHDALPEVSMTLFVVITVLWGAKLASDSLYNELSQGTWDSQRLSGMSAWDMALGKLFGGPVFAWYGGAWCVGVHMVSTAGDPQALRGLLTALLLAVALHAVSLLMALLGWRKLPRSAITPRARGTSIVLLVLLAPQLFFSLRRIVGESATHWYGLAFSQSSFTLLCVALAAFWAVLGLVRAMREELSFRDPPTAWVAFLLFVFAFAGGWIHGHPGSPLPGLSPWAAHLAAGLSIALLASYVMLFSERKDWVRMRRLVSLWQAGEPHRAWTLTPKWAASAALTTMFCALFALACLLSEPLMPALAATGTALATLAFLLRDGALVLGLNFTRDQSRADAAAAVYLAVLYMLLPGLLLAVGLRGACALFWPPLVYEQPAWLLLGLFQTAFALDFARRRWNALPA